MGGKSLPFPSSSLKISSPDFSSFPISSTTTPSFTGAEKKCKTQFVQAPKDPSSWKNRSSPTKKKNENEEKVESPSNKEGGYPISSFRGNPEVRDDRSLKKKKSSSVVKESFRSTAFPPTSFSSLPPTPALKAFMDAIPSQVDVTQARRLALAHCHLTSLPASLSSPLSRICALDLSHNDLHATQDLSLLTCMAQLSNLNLSHNPHLGGSLEFLLRSPLESAPPSSGSLVVLSVAHCKLHSLKGLAACQSTLKTLVANDNNLFLYSPFSADSSSIDSFCEDDEILSTPSSLPSTTPQERQWGIESYLALQAASLLESVILSRNTLLGTLSPPSSSLASLSSSDAAGKSVATRAAVEKRNSKKDERVENSESISDCRRGNKSNTEKKSYKKLDEDNDKEEEKERCNWEMQEQQANKHPLSVFAHLPHLKKLSLSACGISSLPSRFFLPLATEIRLSHNALSSLHPESFLARSLHVLDVSHNLLSHVNTFRRFKYLLQLNIRGNPIWDVFCERDANENGYSHEITQRMPPSLMRELRQLLPELVRIDGVEVKEYNLEPSSSSKRSRELANKRDETFHDEEAPHKERGGTLETQNEEAEKEGIRETVGNKRLRSSSGDVEVVDNELLLEEEEERVSSKRVSNTSFLHEDNDPEDVVVDLPIPPSFTGSGGTASMVRRERHYLVNDASASTWRSAGKSAEMRRKEGRRRNALLTLRGSAAVAKVLKEREGFQGGW